MRKFNLLSEELGTEITEVSDEFFGEAKKLILDTTPIDGSQDGRSRVMVT